MSGSIVTWNIGLLHELRSDVIGRRLGLVHQLLAERRPAVLLLQEAPIDALQYLRDYHIERSGSLVTLVRTSNALLSVVDRSSQEVGDSRPKFFRCTIRAHLAGLEIDVWNVHLTSRVGTTDHERARTFRDLMRAIDARRIETGRVGGAAREICGGDFNEEPFSSMFVGVDVERVLDAARRKGVDTQAVRYFNPSWSILGLTQGVAGSFYDSGRSPGPWCVFDQIWVSLPVAISESAGIIDTIGGRPLVSSSGVINPSLGSDHLPVIAFFSFENRTVGEHTFGGETRHTQRRAARTRTRAERDRP